MEQLTKRAGATGAICSVAAIIAIVLNAGHVRTNERGLELIGNAEVVGVSVCLPGSCAHRWPREHARS